VGASCKHTASCNKFTYSILQQQFLKRKRWKIANIPVHAEQLIASESKNRDGANDVIQSGMFYLCKISTTRDLGYHEALVLIASQHSMQLSQTNSVL